MKKGFSLIELIVVIGIIGLLAAVAVPTYSNYSARAKIVADYQLLLAQARTVIEGYQKSGGATWPTITGSLGPDFTSYSYRRYPIDTGGGLGIMLVANMNSNFNKYCTGGSCQMAIAMIWTQNIFKTYCGIWTPTNAYDFPSSMLPPNCNCTNMSGIWGTGIIPGGGTGTDNC